jgi:hypothetical protein
MLTATHSTRPRLLAAMDRLFADDAGLGVLAKYRGRPDLSPQAKKLQTAWVRAMIAVHGRERAASVYTQYAMKRQKTVTEPIGSWDNLLLNTKPFKDWTRDTHGFTCVSCGGPFPSVVIDLFDAVCNRCARDNSTPQDAQPHWQAYSHHEFVFPGLLPEQAAKGERAIVLEYQDGEKREYVTGEIGLVLESSTSLPNFTRSSAQSHGESREAISITVEARTEHERRSFDISATFTYDRGHDTWEQHAYGFRFVSARLARHSRRLGHYDLGEPAITEHTDLYETIGTLLTGLYGAAGDLRSR